MTAGRKAEKHPKSGKSKKGRPKKFHILKHQISFLFIGLFLVSIFAITAINGLFLEKYYVSKKEDVLLEAMSSLKELDEDDLIENTAEAGRTFDEGSVTQPEAESDGTETDGKETKENILADGVPDDLSSYSSRNNLSWVLMNEESSKYLKWGENERLLRLKLFGYIYDIDGDRGESTVLKQTDSYAIQQIHDRFAGMDYVECWGRFDSGIYFLIRTPLESIRESAAISNGFYFVVGLLITMISGFLMLIFTKRITRPISELTKLSQRMSNLDFDARYESDAGNEIDVLGDNFNKMSAQLVTTISELKSVNNELQRDIENKIEIDRQRKEFLDNVSHELKTPIALVQGYAEGLKENISDDQESREFYCDVIMDEAAKMNKLVKNLLILNQLESGKDAAAMERFDIVSLIRGVLQSMDIIVQQKNAKVIFDQEKQIHVWADEFKIEEVVTNYVSNALNHLDGERQIEIKITDQENNVRVSVFNTGTPIPEQDIPNVWNKFYKVDKARTREYGGSGIGLSIVKAIMEGLNQQFGVQNYDNGVEFWFTLDRK